jgi:hypothetical protein
MSATVTLELYSGRPNPSWELDDRQIAELARRIQSLTGATLTKPPGIAGGLGYRGFRIESSRVSTLDPDVYVHAGIVDLNRFDTNRIETAPELESWLLSTAGNALESEETDYVDQQIQPQFTTFHSGIVQPFVVPSYNPGKWNNDSNIRTRNNCYNYGNDKITNTFAQPGRGSGQIFSALDCGNVGAAAQRDGQIPVSSASSTPAQGHYVALVIWPGRDYHWYRLDDNTMWTHKPGQTPAKNTDNSGQLIRDPRSCDRGPYTVFCGFYHCIPAQTRIN